MSKEEKVMNAIEVFIENKGYWGGQERPEISDDLINDFGLDALDRIELIMDLEVKLNILIDTELENLLENNTLIDYWVRKISKLLQPNK